jgi:hypothetical protein
MRMIACCVIGCFFLLAGFGCERTDKAVETYKKVKEDAQQRAQEAKEGAQKVMEQRAKEALKIQDTKQEEQK